MRLSDFEIETIKTVASLHFGSDVQVFLFGSRADDSARGGDIDLFVTASDTEKLNTRTKISFMTDIIMLIGDRHIDVILDNKKRIEDPFLRTIRKSAVKIC